MTAPARIRQTDVTRIFKGAKNAGFTRVRVAIDVHGNLIVEASDEPDAPIRANPLDRLLSRQ